MTFNISCYIGTLTDIEKNSRKDKKTATQRAWLFTYIYIRLIVFETCVEELQEVIYVFIKSV